MLLEDLSGCISAIAFDSVLAYSKDTLSVNEIYVIKGKVEMREDAPPEIICSGIKKFNKDEYVNINEIELDEYIDASAVIVNISNESNLKKLETNKTNGGFKNEKELQEICCSINGSSNGILNGCMWQR